MLSLIDFRVRQRDFLLEITRAITAQLELSEVLRRVLNASTAMLAGKVGLIALRDTQGFYRIRATLGIDATIVPSLHEKLRDLITAASEARDYETLDIKLREMGQLLDEKLVQSFALPLVFGGEPRGLLIVFRTFAGKATPDDVQVLQSFADQASIAVHNAQLYERIEYERRQLGAILQYSGDGVMTLDANLHLVSLNRAVERMTAWTAKEAVGLSIDEVIQWKRVDKGDLRSSIDEAWLNNKGQDREESIYVEGDIFRRDGLSLSVGIRYSPLYNASGELVNIIANMRDITNFRQAQEMQNVFISTISHELKTPVALIKGYAATLRRDDVEWDADTVREYSTVIEEEADRLTSLIENLLTASKLQAEQSMVLNVGEVHLDELTARSAERFSTQSPKHKIGLRFPKQFPSIPGDSTRLRQVIDNLIGNALKYSPDGGKIDVSGKVEKNTVSVSVRDEGVGISEADQEHIFTRFYRVDGALSRRTQGTGLGLYLAKAIIDAHYGRLTVESKPGKGSTFTFTLPLN